MSDEWPNWAAVKRVVETGRFMSGNDEFITFKKKVVKASSEELDLQADHAPVMWEFLIGFAKVKKIYRNFIIQVFHKLMQVPSWVDAWRARPELIAKVQELPEDLQAALGLQHEAIKSSLTPAAVQSMAKVAVDERPDEVRRDIERERMVDEIRQESAAHPGSRAAMTFDLDAVPEAAESPDVHLDSGGGGGGAEGGGRDRAYQALQEGVDAVLAIDDMSRLDNEGAGALNLLRIGCIMCAGKEELMQKEADNAPSVFAFLVSYLRRKPDSIERCAEVMNQLMASPSWSAMSDGATLRESIQELPVEVQAALGMQHEKLLAIVGREAQLRAKGGDVSDRLKSVAVKMQSIRAPPTAGAAAKPPPPPPAQDVWKEARTPEGHAYYYNLRTRETTWTRPAALGGPRAYKVGDEVEVWSNSQRVWGRGRVEAVTATSVTASFVFPDGAAAKKELPATHRDIRPALVLARQGWSAQEDEAYRRWFLALAGGSKDSKPGSAVAEFLLKSGLRKPVLKQLWQVAVPGAKPELGFEEFAQCCRLVAHCQALGPSDPLIQKAERPLRVKLREECLPARPPRLPTF